MSILSYYHGSLYLLAVIVTVGCREAEQIQSYTVPKEPPRIAAGEAASATGNQPTAQPPQAEPTDRMLAAILPEGQQAWFFKVVGPIAAIDKHADAISEFFATIRPAGDQQLPAWKLPAEWTFGPGNPMRAATIVIPGDKPLELTVTKLGWTGTAAAMLSNINRWRGQMQLPPINEQQLADSTSELKAGDATMTLVDMKGRFQSTMTPPFAGGAPFAGGEVGAASRAAQDGATNLPADHPPVGPSAPPLGTPPARLAQSNLPKFEAPSSWQAAPGGEFSRAAFNVVDGSKTARVTVSEFPAGAPMIADPLANVNRWRGEVGLAPVDQDALAKITETIEVDGQAATYMPAIPDASKAEESAASEATLAAMVPHGDRVWFFKIKGDRDLVAAEQERFKDFLKSVRFAADRGATDGN